MADVISENEIENFVNEVVRRFSPEKVVLFGSSAENIADSDSDVDILIVMETKLSTPKQATEIRLSVPRSFPMDLIIRSPQEMKRRLAMGDPFFTEIIEKGRVLYERSS